jgi:hypothetical protein
LKSKSDYQYRIVLTDINISQNHSSLLQGYDPKGSCSGFKSRQRDWEPAFRDQHVDAALWKDLFSSNRCGSSCVIAQKELEGHVALRLFVAGVAFWAKGASASQ